MNIIAPFVHRPVATTLLTIGVALAGIVSFGLLPKNLFTEYGIQFGSALEMILLSFALAYRYAALRSDSPRGGAN